jgi:hypothetical protein
VILAFVKLLTILKLYKSLELFFKISRELSPTISTDSEESTSLSLLRKDILKREDRCADQEENII